MGIHSSTLRTSRIPPNTAGDPIARPHSGGAPRQPGPASTGSVEAHLPGVAAPPRQYSTRELGGSVAAISMTRAARLANIRNNHLGPNLARLLGDVSPLDGAATPRQRQIMKDAMENLKIRAELVVLDQNGRPSPTDMRVLTDVYAGNFPEHEAIGIETVIASLRDRQQRGAHLDGKRFTLTFTGVLPSEPESRRRPLAFAQGGTLEVGPGKRANYAEYWATNNDFRRQGVLDVLMGFNSAISMASAKKENAQFLGTFWEMEPVGTGPSSDDRLYSRSRANIYGRKEGYVVMGVNEAGGRVPYHVQPDVTANGTSGPVPLHLVYRSHDPERSSLDLETLTRFERSYDGYFNEWARTNRENGLPGVSEQRVAEAAKTRRSQVHDFKHVTLLPAAQSDTAMQMARDNPLIASIVADNFRLPVTNPGTALDFSDPYVRLSVSHLSGLAFETETAWAPVYVPQPPAYMRPGAGRA